MKGFETQHNDTISVIENWTLQQCKEYLSQYPNGLKADFVKTRLAQLEPFTPPKKKPQKNINIDNNVKKISSTDKSMGDIINDESSGTETFWKILLSIGALALAFGLGWIFDIMFDINIKHFATIGGFVLWREIWK